MPQLVREGYLEDVTQQVGGAATKTIKFRLDPKRWAKRRIAKTLALDAKDVPQGVFEVRYVPIRAMLTRLGAVPPGTVLSVVRADVPWTPDVVTHQGLVLVRPNETTRFVRHASPVAKRVIDEPLDHMMKRYDKPKGWLVVGVNLLRIVDPLKTQVARTDH
jgi:hypothetical protein